MAVSKEVAPAGRKIVQVTMLPSPPRIVVLCDDHSIWQRLLDPSNHAGGERFIWRQIEPPPAE